MVLGPGRVASVICVDAQTRMSASHIEAMPNCELALTSTHNSPDWYLMGVMRGFLARLKNGRSIMSRWSRIGMSAKLDVKMSICWSPGGGARRTTSSPARFKGLTQRMIVKSYFCKIVFTMAVPAPRFGLAEIVAQASRGFRPP